MPSSASILRGAGWRVLSLDADISLRADPYPLLRTLQRHALIVGLDSEEDEIDYDAFALRVPEGANVNATVAAVGTIPPARLRRMAAAMARAAPLLDYRDGLVDAALRHVVKVAASWSPQNYFNACKTPVASRSPRALRPVYASSECEAVEPASASIRCQDETQPI